MLNSNSISFEECFNKHFPMAYELQSIMLLASPDLIGDSSKMEENLLRQVIFYDGTYEMEESLMGAFVMHVALGNIEGWDINDLLANGNFTSEFISDIRKLEKK